MLRLRLLVWGQIAQVLRLRMASSLLFFAGRDKTSSSELGVELGIKVNLHTPRICEENVPRDGYGNTFLVHDAMSDFASSLTWFGDVGPCTERCDVGFCFVFDMVQYWR